MTARQSLKHANGMLEVILMRADDMLDWFSSGMKDTPQVMCLVPVSLVV